MACDRAFVTPLACDYNILRGATKRKRFPHPSLPLSPVSTPVEFNSVNNSASFSFFADVWAHTPPPPAAALAFVIPPVPAATLAGPDFSPPVGGDGADARPGVAEGTGLDMGLYPSKLSEGTHDE
jgi:hypothetical protein